MIPVNRDLSWQHEFARRYMRDSNVAECLAMAEGNNEVISGLVEDGADIYDKLKHVNSSKNIASNQYNLSHG